MPQFGIATYRAAGGPRSGLIVDDYLVDIAQELARAQFGSMFGILSAWEEVLPLLNKLASKPSRRRVPLSHVQLLAPVPAPLAIYCVGANYRDHILNMARAHGRPPEPDPRELGMPPWHFLKSGRCVVGTEVDVPLTCEKLDWEAELAVVIGRSARNVSARDALEYVAGYTIANDLSARDRIFRTNGDPKSPFFFDFVAQKSFDGSCPLGPIMIPAKFVSNPQSLAIQLWVNEQLRINSSTSQMIYSIADQIAHLSSFVTLHPGDLILTGTPAGAGEETGEYLNRGDVVRITIEGLGTLQNRIV